ncbi:hypothetical protein BOTBODRAFT_37450 [Botryobasidium botryosum FD-172 SS1]|uniref:F-box domain-containing protein n=1 Tax=Botryobasidium botryosum (strain FD-172 SS1) TaxID=930990 RepID=A0A067M2J2_BOTB1|nr:hypothetical protein BOTBODRAFT_37450 [Botryobasidium botryosum FD-172 SS1]
MRNLREVSLLDAAKCRKDQITKAIGSLVHLRHLEIWGLKFSTLDQSMENLTGLRSITLQTSDFVDHCRGAPPPERVIKVVYNCRSTLERLSILHASWEPLKCLEDLKPAHPACAADISVWTRLHTLDLRYTSVFGMETLDLSAAFPSVRCFASPLNTGASWTVLPRNSRFLSNLRLFHGCRRTVESASPSLSKTRCLIITGDLDALQPPLINCVQRLPPTVQALELASDRFPPLLLDVLATSAPQLAFLLLDLTVATHREALRVAEELAVFLPRLPLSYVIVRCYYHLRTRNEQLAEAEQSSHWDRVASVASSLDTMKAYYLSVKAYEKRGRRDGAEDDFLYGRFTELSVHGRAILRKVPLRPYPEESIPQ